ncbi:B3 domain-containing protein Os06g0107800-like [Oryza brachyantha]|uniref:TF-B3 domain-containing protein n=1 Tax=Oryza brachyantha TaxID=4533 RepID=J3MAL1_ORYBR|nr:B3 domain-containing protein Os06g0107800-like [Oryza brachyantha]
MAMTTTMVAWESRRDQLQGGGGGGHGHGGERREHMFEKVVTPSDVGKLNRLVVPKHYAEKYFPLGAAARSSPAGTVLCFEDARRGGGETWRFRYSYWSSSQSYVITKGWSRFVRDKRLVAGDTVSFCRAGGRLFIDCRRRAAVPPTTSSLAPQAASINVQRSSAVDEKEAAAGCGGRCLRLFGVDLQLLAEPPALDLQL